MLFHKKPTSDQGGYTIVELTIAIVLMAIIGTTFLVFFKSTFFNYLNLQSDASNVTQINTQAMRVATVVRGTTGISSVAANDYVAYSYFYPSDAYVSVVHYYVQTSGSIKQLLVDVTPMTANPPVGTLRTNDKKTYTVIDNLYQPVGGAIFTYLDSTGTPLTLPVAELQTIKGIRISLATKNSNSGNQVLDVQVSLRNRKTNL